MNFGTKGHLMKSFEQFLILETLGPWLGLLRWRKHFNVSQQQLLDEKKYNVES